MKYTIHQILDGEDELILNYQKATEEVEAVLVFMEKQQNFAMLFFYCLYRLCVGLAVAEILHMAQMIFLTYVVFLYFCVFLVYKCRRKIDDKILNYDLELFKTKSK